MSTAAKIQPPRAEIISVVKFLHDRRLTPHACIIEHLQQLDRDNPELSFSDFVAGVRLAFLAVRKSEGNA
jgi:hypothetical protein